MKISLNWLSEYIDVAPIRADIKSVLGKLTMRGLEVESIQDLSKGFDKVVIAQVEVRDRHPNADRLSVCRVNNGKEVLQIVCGAQNFKAGDKVALSMIGASLPNGMKIEKGKIRDVESFGMLCSETELGMADESEGILILPKDAPVGQPLAPFLGRDDIIFELNVTPNRGDALSHIGVARELAAILGQKVKLPAPKLAETSAKASDKVKVTIASDACYQYHARFIEGIKVGPSPEWLKKRLLAIGLRPISNIVDVTNFVLMEFGQPLHAFDASQVKGGQIQARFAKAGEKMPLLDGTEITLTAQDLVIADTERAIALAGVMGGGNSEVTEKTTSILLEAAQFAPSSVRRTARRFQKHSDSSYRFERQVDAKAVVAAMDRAAALMAELGAGKIYKGYVSQYSAIGEKIVKGEALTVKTQASAVGKFLGLTLTKDQVRDALVQVGFGCEVSGDSVVVKVPSYRPDVETFEDITEEVLRVWGYDKVEAVVPKLEFIPDPSGVVDQRSKQIEKLKQAFVQHGFNEAVNFAFTSKASNDRWGGKGADAAIKVANPLNEEFTTMKTSLVGGLIENLLTAVRHQQSDLRLFEVRPVYLPSDSETGVNEEWRVAAVMCGRAYSHFLASRDQELDFYDAKGVLEGALDTIGTRGYRYLVSESAGSAGDARWHPAQFAEIGIGRGPCGFVARLHPKIEAELKLRQPVYVFEFSLDRALEIAKSLRKYTAIPKFPKVQRDLSLLVPMGLASEKVTQAVQKHGKPLVETVDVVDTYVGDKIQAGLRSLSISFWLSDSAKTLEDGDVDSITRKILTGLEKDLGVKLRLQ
jgi:phenylalanyl-tRNA synthetase beta chain